METYRTEEEQIDAIKRWWRENGKSTVVGIALALTLVFGWRGWQDNQQNALGEASALFQNLLLADANLQRGASSKATAEQLADTLKDQHGGSSYGQFAGLFKAKYAVQSGDYPAALAELDWVIKQKPDDNLLAQIKLRQAQIYFAQGENQKALAALDALDAPAYTALSEELRGDILFAEGDHDAALQAYKAARDSARNSEAPINNPVLDMKINDLSVADKGAA